MQTSVLTDEDEENEKNKCAVCAVMEFAPGMEGLPKARRNGT